MNMTDEENIWINSEWKSRIIEYSVIQQNIYDYPIYTLGRLRAWWERGKGFQTVLTVFGTRKLIQKCRVRTYRLIKIGE